MKMKWIMVTGVVFSFILCSCQGNNTDSKIKTNDEHQAVQKTQKQTDNTKINPLITFVELGSVNCIPCRKMQPVMKAIEKKYGGQVKVIFYDVWTDSGHDYAENYGIRLIPTQVFLNEQGEEIFRHEGFFPENEIDKFLQEQGLTQKAER